MKEYPIPKVLVIVGPTASGKSALGVEMARRFGGEIVSADSRQVYRGLDIGTGKITKREMKGVPHHLLDVASPRRVFTADDFVRLGRQAIAGIARRGRVPIVVGGTGFYIDALLGRISLAPAPPDPALRRELGRKSAGELFDMLSLLDPERAATADPNNPRRLIRAIEIARALGSVPPPAPALLYDTLSIGVAPEQALLEEKIRLRLSARLRQGMVAEARRLHADGLSFARMEALGLEYRWLARLLRGDVTRTEMEKSLAADIIRYAKRQKTYWRRRRDIVWFAPEDHTRIAAQVGSWLS